MKSREEIEAACAPIQKELDLLVGAMEALHLPGEVQHQVTVESGVAEHMGALAALSWVLGNGHPSAGLFEIFVESARENAATAQGLQARLEKEVNKIHDVKDALLRQRPQGDHSEN